MLLNVVAIFPSLIDLSGKYPYLTAISNNKRPLIVQWNGRTNGRLRDRHPPDQIELPLRQQLFECQLEEKLMSQYVNLFRVRDMPPTLPRGAIPVPRGMPPPPDTTPVVHITATASPAPALSTVGPPAQPPFPIAEFPLGIDVPRLPAPPDLSHEATSPQSSPAALVPDPPFDDLDDDAMTPQDSLDRDEDAALLSVFHSDIRPRLLSEARRENLTVRGLLERHQSELKYDHLASEVKAQLDQYLDAHPELRQSGIDLANVRDAVVRSQLTADQIVSAIGAQAQLSNTLAVRSMDVSPTTEQLLVTDVNGRAGTSIPPLRTIRGSIVLVYIVPNRYLRASIVDPRVPWRSTVSEYYVDHEWYFNPPWALVRSLYAAADLHYCPPILETFSGPSAECIATGEKINAGAVVVSSGTCRKAYLTLEAYSEYVETQQRCPNCRKPYFPPRIAAFDPSTASARVETATITPDEIALRRGPVHTPTPGTESAKGD